MKVEISEQSSRFAESECLGEKTRKESFFFFFISSTTLNNFLNVNRACFVTHGEIAFRIKKMSMDLDFSFEKPNTVDEIEWST